MQVITVDNKMVLIVTRPILAKEQLFVSYGPVSCRDRKKFRKKMLSGFGFKCKCEACLKNFPTLARMEMVDRLFVPPRMSRFSHARAIDQYRQNCHYIQSYFDEQPTYLNGGRRVPTFEAEFLIKHNDHLLHGIAKDIYDNNGQGKEKNVFCNVKYNFYLEENQVYGELEGNDRDYP